MPFPPALRRPLVVVLAGLSILASSVVGAVAATAAPAPAPCREAWLFAAAGSRADVVGAVAGPLAQRLGDRLRVVTTPPPAGGTSYAAAEQQTLGAFTKSVGDVAARCPDAKLMLLGFSEGAHVAGDLASRIGTGQERGIPADRVLAVGLVGDPARSPFTRVVPAGAGGQGVLPVRAAGFGALEPRTIEVCAPGDPVCDSPARAAFPSLEQALTAPPHAAYPTLPVARGLTATQWASVSLATVVEKAGAAPPPAPAGGAAQATAASAPVATTTAAPTTSAAPPATTTSAPSATTTTGAAATTTSSAPPATTTTGAAATTTSATSGRATSTSGRAAPTTTAGRATTSSGAATSSGASTSSGTTTTSTTTSTTSSSGAAAASSSGSVPGDAVEGAADAVFALAGVRGFDLGQGGNIENGEVPVAVASPNVPGREAVKLELPAGGKRSEVRPQDAAQEVRPGERLFFGYSAFLPEGFPTDAQSFQVIWQLHDGGTNTSPPVALEVQRGRLWLANVGDLVQDLGPVAPGQNVAVQMDIEFAIGGGTVSLWRDGRQVLDRFAPPKGTMIDQSDFLKTGIYRDGEGAPATSLFLNDLKVGDSMAAVADLAGAPPEQAAAAQR